MISTGSKNLNEFLKDYKNEITVIYGPAASGKTTMGLLATVEQAKENKKVVFIDTENGFSTERIKQIAGSEYRRLLDNVLLFRIKNFKYQQKKIRGLLELIEKTKISLVVVDTIGFYYRRLLKRHSDLANAMMIGQLKILKELTKKGIPVIITNQVYADIKENKVKIVGGKILKNWGDCLIELQKDPRKLILKKPEEREMVFEIRNEGIFKVE